MFQALNCFTAISSLKLQGSVSTNLSLPLPLSLSTLRLRRVTQFSGAPQPTNGQGKIQKPRPPDTAPCPFHWICIPTSLIFAYFKSPLISTSQLPWRFTGTASYCKGNRKERTCPPPSLLAPSSNWLEFNTQQRKRVWNMAAVTEHPGKGRGATGDEGETLGTRSV